MALSKIVEQVVSFGKNTTEKEVSGEASDDGVLKVYLRQSLSDSCSARNRTACDILLRLLRYQRPVSRFSVESYTDLREKK